MDSTLISSYMYVKNSTYESTCIIQNIFRQDGNLDYILVKYAYMLYLYIYRYVNTLMRFRFVRTPANSSVWFDLEKWTIRQILCLPPNIVLAASWVDVWKQWLIQLSQTFFLIVSSLKMRRRVTSPVYYWTCIGSCIHRLPTSSIS